MLDMSGPEWWSYLPRAYIKYISEGELDSPDGQVTTLPRTRLHTLLLIKRKISMAVVFY